MEASLKPDQHSFILGFGIVIKYESTTLKRVKTKFLTFFCQASDKRVLLKRDKSRKLLTSCCPNWNLSGSYYAISVNFLLGLGIRQCFGSESVLILIGQIRTVLEMRIRIWIQDAKNYPLKQKNVKKISSFEVLDVLFRGLKASLGALTSFMASQPRDK